MPSKIQDSQPGDDCHLDSEDSDSLIVITNQVAISSICRKCNQEYDSDPSDSCVFNINFNLIILKEFFY